MAGKDVNVEGVDGGKIEEDDNDDAEDAAAALAAENRIRKSQVSMVWQQQMLINLIMAGLFRFNYNQKGMKAFCRAFFVIVALGLQQMINIAEFRIRKLNDTTPLRDLEISAADRQRTDMAEKEAKKSEIEKQEAIENDKKLGEVNVDNYILSVRDYDMMQINKVWYRVMILKAVAILTHIFLGLKSPLVILPVASMLFTAVMPVFQVHLWNQVPIGIFQRPFDKIPLALKVQAQIFKWLLIGFIAVIICYDPWVWGSQVSVWMIEKFFAR